MIQATRAELTSALKCSIEVMSKNLAIAVLCRLNCEDAGLPHELKDIAKSLQDEVARLEKILTTPIEN